MTTDQSKPDCATLAQSVARLRKENTQLRKLVKELSETGGLYRSFLDTLKETVEREDKFKYKPRSASLSGGFDKGHKEVAAVALSDLHLSETVRKDDSCGVNEYNSVICANRLWLYSQKVKSILSRHMTMYTIRSIWSPVLGDLVNGSVHMDFLLSNDLSDPAAVVLASRLLYMFYTELASLGLPIEIDCVHGNHPRMTPTMPAKRQAYTNLDWLIYEHLADKLSSDKQFNVKVHTSQIGVKKIFNWNYVFEHGINISGGDEEKLEDRIRALFDDPVYRKATGYKGASFDQLIIGNTHKSRFMERTIVNGCFTGQNELGMSWRLKPIKAIQCMWGISQKHVRTWQYSIDLTSVVSNKAENPFSEYTVWFMKKHSR